MYVLLERMLLGEKSEYWPYLECLPEIDFFCDWPLKEIEACQDIDLLKYASEFKIEIAIQWSQITLILEKHHPYFSPLIDLSPGQPVTTPHATAQFRRAYAQVCTRCFGLAFPRAAMVPMADLLNHSHVRNSVHLMNKTLHQRPFSVQGYYCKELFLTDVRSVYTEAEKGEVKLEFISGFDGETPSFVESLKERSFEGWVEYMGGEEMD